MAESNAAYHEPYDLLSAGTRDLHRALVSIQEELEAVDWYRQRAEACADEELRAVLLHNADEEVEHSLMLLEWVRRKDPAFAEKAETYLFAEGSIVGAEEAATGKAAGGPAPPPSAPEGTPAAPGGGSLGIGSLK